jgi:hypothetical protein
MLSDGLEVAPGLQPLRLDRRGLDVKQLRPGPDGLSRMGIHRGNGPFDLGEERPDACAGP